jgi:hypothetical protein
VPLAGGAVNIPQPGEQEIAGYDFAKNGNVAILQSTPQLPNEIFVVRASSCCQPTRLTRVNDAFLSKIALGPVERFKAKSADGTMIDGYLTRPPTEERRAGPLPESCPPSFAFTAARSASTPPASISNGRCWRRKASRWSPPTHAGHPATAAISAAPSGPTGATRISTT